MSPFRDMKYEVVCLVIYTIRMDSIELIEKGRDDSDAGANDKFTFYVRWSAEDYEWYI